MFPRLAPQHAIEKMKIQAAAGVNVCNRISIMALRCRG